MIVSYDVTFVPLCRSVFFFYAVLSQKEVDKKNLMKTANEVGYETPSTKMSFRLYL